MFSIEFNDEIRAFEFEYYLRHLLPGARVLEIGGGTGIQAKMLAERGFKVECIDVATSEYRDARLFDVKLFDGHTIPFGDASFDVVFSSNVLEHIAHIEAFEEEIKRVLKPNGYCIHSMPSGNWTFWTIITHYINAVQQLARRTPDEPLPANPGNAPGASTRPHPLRWIKRKAHVATNCIRQAVGTVVRSRGRVLPHRHGEFGTVLHELVLFSRPAWKRHFRKTGFELVLAEPMGLFYTGYMILGRKWPLQSRQRWSRLLGSAANFYKVRVVRKDRPGRAIPLTTTGSREAPWARAISSRGAGSAMSARNAANASLAEPSDRFSRAGRLSEQVKDACTTFGLASVTVLVGKPLDTIELAALFAYPKVASIIVSEPISEADIDTGRVGEFAADTNTWTLPNKLARALVVLELPRFRPTFFMAAAAVRRGMTSYIVRDLLRFERRRFAWAAGRRIGRRAALMTLDFLRTVQVRGSAQSGRRVYRLLNIGDLPTKAVHALTRASERIAASSAQTKELRLNRQPLLPPDAFVKGRVLMINSALAWGGAERQLVNTILGLMERGLDLQLVCEWLGRVPDSDFFAWRLKEAQVEIASLRREIDAFGTEGELPAALSPALLDALSVEIALLPEPLRSTVIPYALEMIARRPYVVHAWQDQTSVAAGVAAVIVGVPGIVLSTRNLSPPNFAYFQPHMRETYRALARVPRVRILNNSEAGRADYAAWLGVPRSTIARLYNGLDFDCIVQPTVAETRAFRAGLGISPDHKVVGSVFRLYSEKDPLLWLDMAARVARARADVSFLIIGTGPMRDELMARAKASDFGGRLILPGTLQHPERAFALMDVFVLTSRFEGVPNVVIEAQCVGVPVVATQAGGTGEAFVPGETGWLIERRDAGALAERVLTVLADQAWARTARAKAPAFSLDRFGLARMIDETVALYSSFGGA
jgi:glycosyltransferase involved in cell wall biosynthesis/SAM-dependent methyltransferase